MCHFSVKLLQGLCALCVCARHLTDALEAQAWVNLGLISTSDLEHQPLCLLLVFASDSLHFVILFFFFS